MSDTPDDGEKIKCSNPQSNDSSSDMTPLCMVDSVSRLKISELRVEPLLFMIFFSSSLSSMISCESLNYTVENCTNLDSVPGSVMEQEVQPLVAKLSMYKSWIETPLPALMSLFLGSWSDKYGRRPIILASLTGMLFQQLLLILFSSINVSPFYVLLTSVPVIFTGGSMLLLSAIFSYISDQSEGKHRTYKLALGEALIYLGILVGTTAAPFIYPLFPSYGFQGVFSLSWSCILITLFYTIFFVPESVIVQPRSVSLLKSVVDWHHITDVIHTCFQHQNGSKRVVFVLLVTCSTLNLIVIEGLPSVLYLFTRSKFAWTLKDFSMYGDAAIIMLICGIALGTIFATKWVSERNEGLVACFAFLSKTVAYIIGGLSPVSWGLYLSSAVSALSGVAGPICRSILCKCVQSNDIGKAFVFLSFLDSLVPMVSSTMYSSLYSSTLETFPGAIFILSAVLAATTCIIMGWISYFLRISSRESYSALYDNESPSTSAGNETA